MLANMTCTCPASRSTSRGPRAAIRHVHEVDASHHFEEFTENVISGTMPPDAMLILPELILA
jgi:hypothetical protein